MFSLRSILRAWGAATPAAFNDNPAASDTFAASGLAADADGCRHDPYLCEAVEARRLMGSARLISAVDGSSSAVLNVMSAGRRPAA